MFQFLQPIWLFASAGIVIPVIIHLWNIRKGKTLRVGSILLLQESISPQKWRLRFKDILLLILRCMLIISLAFLLAGPVWKKQLTSTDEKGWVMIEEQNLMETYKNFKPAIDSLISAGYKFHYFNNGFKPDKLKDALERKADTGLENRTSYWTLLKQLNEQVPANLPVYLFTGNKLKNFSGVRPQVTINLKWNTYTYGDTLSKRLVNAYRTEDDSIRINVAVTKPERTLYNSENIAAAGNDNYRLINSRNKILLTSAEDKMDTIKVDTSVLNIIIYTDHFITDAGYLKTALDAIQQYTQRKIKVSIVNNSDEIKAGNDWLFWLSEKTLPPQKLSPDIFVYEKGKEKQVNSWITTINSSPVQEQLVHLSHFVENDTFSNNKFETLWGDGFGHQILNLEKTNSSIYHFYSRFDPAWNDLPWNSQFVEMIYELLFKNDLSIKNFDKRIIDAKQLQPEITKKNEGFDKDKFVEINDLTKLLWLVAFIIFCIERYISLSGKSVKNV